MNDIVSMRVNAVAEAQEANAFKHKIPIAIPGYCPECHYFNFLEHKSKDGKDICERCWRKEL